MLVSLVHGSSLSNRTLKYFLENKVGIYPMKMSRCIFIVCTTTDFLRENLEVSNCYFVLEIWKKPFPRLNVLILCWSAPELLQNDTLSCAAFS